MVFNISASAGLENQGKYFQFIGKEVMSKVTVNTTKVAINKEGSIIINAGKPWIISFAQL